MRNHLITFATAASALAIAAPASAQYSQGYDDQAYAYQQPDQYGYGNQQPNQNGYGNWGQGRIGRWTRQVEQIREDIRQLSARGALDWREVRQLRHDTAVVRNAIQKYGRNGLTRYEASDLDRRVRNLELAVRRSANDGDRRYGRNQNGHDSQNAFREGGYDRDSRDNRDDGRRDD